MVGWHHQLNGHELGVHDGQGRLGCCSPWGRKESDTTEQLNWTERCTVCCFDIHTHCEMIATINPINIFITSHSHDLCVCLYV